MRGRCRTFRSDDCQWWNKCGRLKTLPVEYVRPRSCMAASFTATTASCARSDDPTCRSALASELLSSKFMVSMKYSITSRSRSGLPLYVHFSAPYISVCDRKQWGSNRSKSHNPLTVLCCSLNSLLQWNANRKSYATYRISQSGKPMTLNELQGYFSHGKSLYVCEILKSLL